MCTFVYSFERLLPNGAWQRVNSSINASSESEVERYILSKEPSPVRNICIKRK